MRTIAVATKSLLLLTFLFQLSQKSLLGQPSYTTNGLVAYYPFNGNGNDASGNGNNGVLHGVAPSPDRLGNAGAAFHFGVGNYIEVPSSDSLLLTDKFTISAWINADSFSFPPGIDEPELHAIVSKVDWTGWSGGYEFNINAYSPSSGGVNVGGTFGGDRTGASSPLSGNQKWHFVATTYTEGNLQLAVDGVITTNVPVFGALEVSTNTLRIGTRAAPYHEWFIGSIDEIRLFNRALSAEDIQLLYKYEKDPFGPRRARAVVQVVNGAVVGATITDTGFGYTNSPTVLIVGGGGNGATATAQISNGEVSEITITGAGSGYTGVTRMLIGSPPFLPSLSIAVSRVNVTLSVVLGRKYQLQSSSDLLGWTSQGEPFVAQDESITQEFVVGESGQYFRIQEIP